MANHVYFSIHLNASEKAVKNLNDSLATEMVEVKTTWGGEPLEPPYNSYKELKELEVQPFMASANPTFDSDGYLENSWDWYVNNIGAKWCNLEDWNDDYFSGYSAWSPPIGMVEHIVAYLGQWDEDATAYMTYEDEFRNFVGIADFGVNSEGEGYSDYEELDGDDIHNELKKKFGNEVESENFWDKTYEIDGEEVCPNEWLDDLIYSYFENRSL